MYNTLYTTRAWSIHYPAMLQDVCPRCYRSVNAVVSLLQPFPPTASLSRTFSNSAHPLHAFRQDELLEAMKRGETLSDAEISLANTAWAQVKHDPVASDPFVKAAQEHRESVAAAAAERIFRVAQGAPDRGIFRVPGDGPGTLRVDASVSEISGDFRMRVDDKPGEGGKACRTKVEVLETGRFRGQPVTKLLLRCGWWRFLVARVLSMDSWGCFVIVGVFCIELDKCF